MLYLSCFLLSHLANTHEVSSLRASGLGTLVLLQMPCGLTLPEPSCWVHGQTSALSLPHPCPAAQTAGLALQTMLLKGDLMSGFGVGTLCFLQLPVSGPSLYPSAGLPKDSLPRLSPGPNHAEISEETFFCNFLPLLSAAAFLLS